MGWKDDCFQVLSEDFQSSFSQILSYPLSVLELGLDHILNLLPQVLALKEAGTISLSSSL